MTIDIVALILIPALVAAAIRIVFRQTRASFTAFRRLMLLAMVLSAVELIRVAARIATGSLASGADWAAAILASLAAVGCLYFALFKIKQ